MTFYIPKSIIDDSELGKDLRLLVEMNKIGWESTLYVFDSWLSTNSVRVKILTNHSHEQRHGIAYSSSNIRQGLVETWRFLRYVRETNSPVYFIYNFGLFVWTIPIIIRFFSRLHKRKDPFFLLKLDSDGSNISPGIFGFVTRLIFMLSGFLYDQIIVETDCGVEYYKRFIFNKEKIKMVPNGYDQEIFKPIPYSASAREPIIASVARISREKNLDVLIRAFSLIIEKHPNWILRIIGPVDDNSYFEELKTLVLSLDLKSRVLFIGGLEPREVRKELLRSSIFALLSERESFGIVRFEAIACGLPVVISEAGCGTSYVDSGAIVVPIGNAQIAAEALDRLMSDENLRSGIVTNLQSISKSWSQIAKTIDSIIRVSGSQ